MSKNVGTSDWDFVSNTAIGKFGQGTPTVGECDINDECGWSVVYSTWQRGARVAKCDQQSTTDRRLLIALGVQLQSCVQRNRRLGVRQRRDSRGSHWG